MRVRPSAIETFQRCPLRWVLSAVGAEASPDTKQTVGTAVHAVAQQVAEGLPAADAPAALAAELDQLDLGPGWSDQRQRQTAQDMLGRFLAWHAADGRELVGVEIEFDATVGRASIRGKVDRLERDADGRLVVVDLKTGKTPAKNVEEHGQLAAYQVAVAAGGFGDHGSSPGGAALLQVGTGAKAKEQHQEPLPADVPVAETWAGELLAGGRRGHGRGHLRGAHRRALRALPRAPHLPAPGARSAGDGMTVGANQLSFDDFFAEVPAEPAAPQRLLDPAEVAARCGLSYAPSPEQARVVAAPTDRPLVVVAGAGSGKTETMAARVSWLVANRIVEPEAILGLTFTRKAASELNERVRLRLGALARHPETAPELKARLDIAQPTVSTYHGYAASLVAEHGLRIGVEPGAGVLARPCAGARPPASSPPGPATCPTCR